MKPKNGGQLHVHLAESHDDGNEDGQQNNGDGNIAVAHGVRGWDGESAINPIDKPTDEAAPKESDKDVARIMDTEIKTGVPIEK